jgi:hypothetical protein
MYEGSFEGYREEINALMLRVKEWSPELSNDDKIETVNKVLDWIEDKPGQEISLVELGEAIGDPTGGAETFIRIGALCGGKPMMDVIVKVHAPDGSVHLLHDVYRVSEGENYLTPGSLDPIADSREELMKKCSFHFQIADFTREQKLKL